MSFDRAATRLALCFTLTADDEIPAEVMEKLEENKDFDNYAFIRGMRDDHKLSAEENAINKRNILKIEKGWLQHLDCDNFTFKDDHASALRNNTAVPTTADEKYQKKIANKLSHIADANEGSIISMSELSFKQCLYLVAYIRARAYNRSAGYERPYPTSKTDADFDDIDKAVIRDILADAQPYVIRCELMTAALEIGCYDLLQMLACYTSVLIRGKSVAEMREINCIPALNADQEASLVQQMIEVERRKRENTENREKAEREKAIREIEAEDAAAEAAAAAAAKK